MKVCESVTRRCVSYPDPRLCQRKTHVFIYKIIYTRGNLRDYTSERLIFKKIISVIVFRWLYIAPT